MDVNTFLREHGLRPDTWPMFADPAIWRFFGEGLRETILMSLVSIALSFALNLFFCSMIDHFHSQFYR